MNRGRKSQKILQKSNLPVCSSCSLWSPFLPPQSRHDWPQHSSCKSLILLFFSPPICRTHTRVQQNARQKQRKIYENQPNNTLYESEEKKSSNINYTCKKCNLVFQRYYELIRHQKNHCFKEENNKKSAKAQIAAAQIAQSLSSEDSNSSLDINHANTILGNNLLHPVQTQGVVLHASSAAAATQAASSSKQTSSQQTNLINFGASVKNLNLQTINLNLTHPVNLLTTSGTPNIMVNANTIKYKPI